MRASLVSNLKFRAGAPDKDSRITNCFAAQEKGGIVARKRPGLVTPIYSFPAGRAQGGENCFFLVGDSIYTCNSGSTAVAPLLDFPSVIVYIPTQNAIWIYSFFANTRRRFSAVTLAETLPSSFFAAAVDAVYDSTQQVVWATDGQSNLLYRHDVSTGNQVGAAITTGTRPYYLAYDVVQNYIWVACQTGQVLQRFNASTGAHIGVDITVVSAALGIAYTPVDNAIWVSLANNTTLRINAATGTQIGVAISVTTTGFTHDSIQNVMWCPNYQTNDGVIRYNASTGVLIDSVLSGFVVQNLIYDSVNNRVWARSTVNIVAFNGITALLAAGPIAFVEPYDIAYDNTQNAVWIIDRTANTVTKLAAQSGTPL